MDEYDTLPQTLEYLFHQGIQDVAIYICVNQPDAWWDDSDEQHLAVCHNNQATLEWLRDSGMPLHVVDRSSRGRGWKGKLRGVGMARRVLMEAVVSDASDDRTVVVSLDADTEVGSDYLRRVAYTFQLHPSLGAIAAPYYHRLTGNDIHDRRLLRYECYMRRYLLALLKAGSPYAFTAIGSAMAYTVGAYRRCGGVTAMEAGEDFYLMQRIAKTGSVALHLDGADDAVGVFPSGRQSARVPFGTGPAVMQDLDTQAQRYPFFNSTGFASIAATYALFPTLFLHDIETPMSDFLRHQLRSDDLWGPLRRNHKRVDQFVRACHERVDGLRLLQYLRSNTTFIDTNTQPDFAHAPLDSLDTYRNQLAAEEAMLRSTTTAGLFNSRMTV